MAQPKPCKLHGQCHYVPMSKDDWSRIWAEWKTLEKTAKNNLDRHANSMLDGRNQIKILFPLCGDAGSMKRLYDEGHTIIGIDYVEKPLQNFMERHGIAYSTKSVSDGGIVYESSDGRIRLYAMDIYDFGPSHEKDIQGVWDRGGLFVVNIEDRQRYVDTILALLSPDCRYLIELHEYDPDEYTGPPFSMSKDDLEALYGSKFAIHTLQRDGEKDDIRKFLGVSKLFECVFLMLFK